MDSNCGKSRVELGAGKVGTRNSTAGRTTSRKGSLPFFSISPCMLSLLSGPDSPKNRKHDLGLLQNYIVTACYQRLKRAVFPQIIFGKIPENTLWLALSDLATFFGQLLSPDSEGLWLSQEERDLLLEEVRQGRDVGQMKNHSVFFPQGKNSV